MRTDRRKFIAQLGAATVAATTSGFALEIAEPPNGQTKKEFEQQHQKSEFKKSIAHLRAQS
jgi:hypothetical protein